MYLKSVGYNKEFYSKGVISFKKLNGDSIFWILIIDTTLLPWNENSLHFQFRQGGNPVLLGIIVHYLLELLDNIFFRKRR